MRNEKQAMVSKYYCYDKETNKYIISVKKGSVPNEEAADIYPFPYG